MSARAPFRGALVAALPLVLLGAVTAAVSRTPPPAQVGEARRLLEQVGRGWARRDVALALAAFDSTAEYVEPPAEQYFRGHAQLARYFGAVPAGMRFTVHRVWEAPARGDAVAEFTYAREGAVEASHGIVVLRLRGGRIVRWDEYVRRGPAEHQRFLGTSGKQWRWSAANYP